MYLIALLKLSKISKILLFRNLNLVHHFQKISSKRIFENVLDLIVANMVVT